MFHAEKAATHRARSTGPAGRAMVECCIVKTARWTKASAPSPNSREMFLDIRRRPNRRRPCGPPKCVGYRGRFGRFGARRGGGGHGASRRVAREMATTTHPTGQTTTLVGVLFSLCSGHLQMSNMATAPTHRAGSARSAGHAWPECRCCCEMAMLGNVFSEVHTAAPRTNVREKEKSPGKAPVKSLGACASHRTLSGITVVPVRCTRN